MALGPSSCSPVHRSKQASWPLGFILPLLWAALAWLPVFSQGLPHHPNLVAWYPIDPSSSDLVRMASSGTAPTVQPDTFVAGKVGVALRVHDSSESLLLGPVLKAGGLRFTIDLWLRVASGDSLRLDAEFASFLRFGGDPAWRLGLGSGGVLQLRSGAGGLISSTGRIPDTGWHHVALTRDDARFGFFIDGVESGTFDTGWNQTLTDAGWYLGGSGLGALFRGDLDEFAIHSVPLPSEDINDIVLAGPVGRKGADLEVSSISGPDFLTPGMAVEFEWTIRNVGDLEASGRVVRVTYRDMFVGGQILIGGESGAATGFATTLALPTLAPGESVRCRVAGSVAGEGSGTWSFFGMDVSVPWEGWDRFPPNNLAKYQPWGDGACAWGRGDGLVSWLAFEGDSVDRITGRTAQVSGTIGQVPGFVGSALELTGTAGVAVDLARGSGLRQFAWEGWLRPASGGARYGTIVSIEGPGGQTGLGLAIARTGDSTDGYWSIPAGRLAVRMPAVPGSRVDAAGWSDGGADLPEGRWSHVGVTVGDGWLTTYFNGFEVRRLPLVLPQDGLEAASLRIGFRGGGAGPLTDGFKGMIDESAFYDTLTGWSPGLLTSAGRTGRCQADLAVRWRTRATTLRPNIPTRLGFIVENVGAEPMAGVSAVFGIPANWRVESVAASVGAVRLETNRFPTQVRLVWQSDGTMLPGEFAEVSFDCIPAGGGSHNLLISGSSNQKQLRRLNDFDSMLVTVPKGDLFVGGASVSEPASGSRLVEVPVWLGKAMDREVQVDAVAAAGAASNFRTEAKAGLDFVVSSSRLVFPAGVLTQWFRVKILPDNVYEGREGIAVRLANPEGADIEVGEAAIEVSNTGNIPTVEIGSLVRLRPEGPGERMEFGARLSMESELEVRFSYWTTNGTARAGVDYLGTNGVLVFPVGSSRAGIGVELLPSAGSPETGWFQIVGHVSGTTTFATTVPNGGVGTLETRIAAAAPVALGLEVGTPTGADLSIRVQALDWRREPHRSAAGGVRIVAIPTTGRPHPVVMSAIGMLGEISLRSTVPQVLSLKDWTLTLYDHTSWPHPTMEWRGVETNVLAGLGALTLQIRRPGTTSGAIRWDPSVTPRGVERPMVVMLRDPAGNVVDFFSHGDAVPDSVVYPMRLDPAEWPGFEVGLRPQPQVVGAFQGSGVPGRLLRYGVETRGAASEWRIEPPHGTGQVTGMPVPWRASRVTPEVLREVALGVDGAWAGSVKLPSAEGNWMIAVELPSGVRTFSRPIRLGDAGDVGIVSMEISSPVVIRQPGRTPFRLVVSNGSPRAATGLVARVPLPGQLTSSNIHLSTTKGSVQVVAADARGGIRIEAAMGELAAGESAEIRGAMDGFRSEGLPGQLLWAALEADSGNTDQSNDFGVTVLDLIGAPIASAVPFAFWRGEGDFLDRVGTNHARGIGPVEFVPERFMQAFRLRSPDAGIEIPAGLDSDPGLSGSVSLYFLFRLPLGKGTGEPRLLVSRAHPVLPSESYSVEHLDGVIRVMLGGEVVPLMTSLIRRGYDVRDGQWHQLRVGIRGVGAAFRELSVGVDEKYFFSKLVPSTFTLTGGGVPVVLGGVTGGAGFEGDLDEIALFKNWNPIIAFDQLARAGRLAESVLSSALAGQAAFLGPDSATEGRPFRLRILHENTGPVAASNLFVTLKYPPSWTLLSEVGDGGVVNAPGDALLPLAQLRSGGQERREFRFLAPVGSNSVEVAFLAKPGVAVLRRATVPVLVSSDADGDGLPDAWESTAGLSSVDSQDARSDLDGDGIDARGEFEAGTSPTDPASVLRLRWMPSADGRTRLKADSQTGRVYVLERLGGTFSAPVWDAVQTLPGTGQELDFGPFPEDGSDGEYLRIRVIRDR